MSERVTSDDLAKIDQIEAESLTDEELESVAGGEAAATDANTCSCSCCAATATVHPPKEEENQS